MHKKMIGKIIGKITGKIVGKIILPALRTPSSVTRSYKVAMISRLLKIVGLFCRI